MDLTEEQRVVVEIASGRHLVLAPPGSGKTEMLSRRILGALDKGVKPERMLCATFTNRAAFEMRDRVESAAGRRALPDVGNLHHFCEHFLRRVGVLRSGKHVVDEVEQLQMAREVVGVLRGELKAGEAADLKKTHGVTVLAHLKGLTLERIGIMREAFECFLAECRHHGVDVGALALSGITVLHQGRIGIPRALRLPWPGEVNDLLAMGVLHPLEKAYQGLKRRFLAVDFEDLLNETYLRLEREPLPDEKRFSWVQVDEVQDLNPLQWAIVRQLSARDAVSVYFGDLEQAIFSFLGASLRRLHEATADCTVHAFRTNFRSTPLLLEILMRYSLVRLESERAFISEPIDVERANGEIRLETRSDDSVLLAHVDRLLREGLAHEVAILVHSNALADHLAKLVGPLGWRTVKVSGVELGFYRPMRDFLAFVDLFAGHAPRVAWVSLVRRFGEGIHSFTQARYFVRGLFASGWDPQLLFAERNLIPGLIPFAGGAQLWAWRNRRTLTSLRQHLKPLYDRVQGFLGRKGTVRVLFDVFAEAVLGESCRYSFNELMSGMSPGEDLEDVTASLHRVGDTGRMAGDHEEKSVRVEQARACMVAKARIERFLRYTDHVYAGDSRPLKTILAEDWQRLRRLKEADLLVGDERIVISTVHKAKGRQFDAVVVPDVDWYEFEAERLRVLYVAISRAKRHLLLRAPGNAAVLDGTMECFDADYRGYYLRKARGEDLSEDWLWQWERLAELNRARTCDQSRVMEGLRSSSIPVARMAVKVLRHLDDMQERRRLLLGELVHEWKDTAVDILRETGTFDAEVVQAVRATCLASGRSRDWMAALDYYEAGLKAARTCSKLKDVEMFGRLMAECLCARGGDVRITAAETLDEYFGTTWSSVVSGAVSDFDRLAESPPGGIEDALRRILESGDNPKKHEARLRGLLHAVVSQGDRPAAPRTPARRN